MPHRRAFLQFFVLSPLLSRMSWANAEVSAPGLPEWFVAHRVQGHTRLTYNQRKLPQFQDAAKRFRAMGARVFTRHVKSKGEGAWWPSKVGAVVPEGTRGKMAERLIREAHEQNCRVIVYYRHMEDDAMVAKHPAWGCVDWRGRTLRGKRGQYLCYNSPYVDFVATRLKELTELGADGFYFDEIHMPRQGCWCNYCREAFTRETGLKHPNSDDTRDPTWQALADFTNATIVRAFTRWKAATQQKGARDPVFLISSYRYPGLTDRHLSQDLLALADSVKTEFASALRLRPDALFHGRGRTLPVADAVRQALGFLLARDAADGRPAHVWTHGLPSREAALHATAGILAHGNIANLDVRAKQLPDAMLKPSFALGEQASTWLAKATPLRWLAIHYPETARNQLGTKPMEALRRVIHPTWLAFQAAWEKRWPTGVVMDRQLEAGVPRAYRQLILPAPDLLNAAQQQAVRQFREHGGTVIEMTEGKALHRNPKHRDAMLARLAKALDARPPGLRVETPNNHAQIFHAVFYRLPEGILVALCNDFSWVYTGRSPAAHAHEKPPAPCQDIALTWEEGFVVSQAREVLRDQALPIQARRIALPAFQTLSLVLLTQAPVDPNPQKPKKDKTA